jgi:hypothetical protein
MTLIFKKNINYWRLWKAMSEILPSVWFVNHLFKRRRYIIDKNIFLTDLDTDNIFVWLKISWINTNIYLAFHFHITVFGDILFMKKCFKNIKIESIFSDIFTATEYILYFSNDSEIFRHCYSSIVSFSNVLSGYRYWNVSTSTGLGNQTGNLKGAATNEPNSQWWAHIRLFVTSLPLQLHR